MGCRQISSAHGSTLLSPPPERDETGAAGVWGREGGDEWRGEMRGGRGGEKMRKWGGREGDERRERRREDERRERERGR